MGKGNNWGNPLQIRSYDVRTESGGVINRNRKHLRKTPELYTPREEKRENEQFFDAPELPPIELPNDKGPEKQKHSSIEPLITTTRSGRQVKPTERFKDYVLNFVNSVL